MPKLIVSIENIKLLKSQIRVVYNIPSSHLAEAIAFALGYQTNASLLNDIKQKQGNAYKVRLSNNDFIKRLGELGHNMFDEWRGFSSFASSILQMSEEDEHEEILRHNKFSIVWNMLVTPDYDLIKTKKEPLCYLDHDMIDFSLMRSTIADEFRRGPPVNIRICNDTIDHSTLDDRAMHGDRDSIICRDFSEALLNKSKISDGLIVDIRKEWKVLHATKDRRNSPPPYIIPIIVESITPEENLIWGQHAKTTLGMKSGSLNYPSLHDKKKHKSDNLGRLTPRLMNLLHKEFGMRYNQNVFFGIGALDPNSLPYLSSITKSRT